jgi:endonuclease/exonuclease/phosphatase family metal-dependent hydrolase
MAVVRFATFNLENLFARPKVFNLETWSEGEPILRAYAEFNSLIERVNYTEANKARMVELLLELEVYRLDNGVVRRNRPTDPKWAWLRANRGSFDVEHEDTGIEIVANTRFDWTGWLELAKEPIDEVTTNMTAQVLLDVNADVQGVVEVEDRPSLSRFNQDLLGGHFEHVMLIDGNDTRGIDVGIMTRNGVEIVSMQSNVDVPDEGAPGERLFSRDCAEYLLRLPNKRKVRVLLNHFKSQSGGGGPKRARQAQGLRDIVDALLKSGEKNLIVMGDLNEGPDGQGNPSQHFAPLYAPSSPLVDVFSLPTFDPGTKPGTFQSCSTTNRIDYIFVSKNLAPKIVGGGVERHGLWGAPTNKNPPSAWEIYPTITESSQAASDHAAVFVDINI